MKLASTTELKNELRKKNTTELIEYLLRISKLKRENKEFITYLIYAAGDETVFLNQVKNEMEKSFSEMNKSNIYLVKKTARRILRQTNKYCRFSEHDSTTAELLLHYCINLQHAGVNLKESKALNNLFQNLVEKINRIIESLHPDLQHDYKKQMRALISVSQ